MEYSEQESKTIMINMLRILVGKIDSVQEQMGNISGESNQRDANSKK